MKHRNFASELVIIQLLLATEKMEALAWQVNRSSKNLKVLRFDTVPRPLNIYIAQFGLAALATKRIIPDGRYGFPPQQKRTSLVEHTWEEDRPSADTNISSICKDINNDKIIFIQVEFLSKIDFPPSIIDLSILKHLHHTSYNLKAVLQR